jgi:2-haloacid dehalogenase
VSDRPVFSGVRACVFDAYGTIFDFASAAARCQAAPAEQRAALTTLWRDKQLQYAWLRTLQGRYVDFWQVTGEALDYALEALQLDEDLHAPLMALYRQLSPFRDAEGTLRALRAAGHVTAILSNGSPPMLTHAVERGGLDGLFDAVLSVDAMQAFKTHPRVYQHAAQRLGMAPGDILFVSSNGWDAYAASDFGMRVVWCNRYGQPRERLPGQPDAEITSLAELPALLGAE